MPVNADVHELDALFVEARDDILNPLGTKGGAELGLCGVAPAIANAVWHATGKRMLNPQSLLDLAIAIATVWRDAKITMYVTYAGDTHTPFNRDHGINVHLPLVRECWGPHGLVSAAAFFPSGDGGGLIAICPSVFRDGAESGHATFLPAQTDLISR